jgi:hypothetical protein
VVTCLSHKCLTKPAKIASKPAGLVSLASAGKRYKPISEFNNRGIKVDLITEFLANPIAGLVGYVLSLIAAIIAVSQFLGKQTAQERVRELTIEVQNIKTTANENKITQGEKSQYFQENSGPVNIDNRD